MPIFQDPFLDNDHDWEIRDDAHALLKITEGAYGYLFEHRRASGAWTTWQPLIFEEEIAYKIHTVIEHQSGGHEGYGLIWQCQDEDNCRSFELSQTGRYRLRQRVAGNWTDTIPWTATADMRPGNGALNELLIVQLPHQAKFYINEALVEAIPTIQPALGHGFGFVINGRAAMRIHSTIVLRHIEPPSIAPETAATADAPDVQAVLDELNAFVGLANIKQEVRTFVNFLRVQKMRQARSLPTTPHSYHMVLAGPPGTGKTTVARLIGKIYKALGLLPKGHVVETDRAGLVAPYVGQTALKVQTMVEKALGGILFIDEAYALQPKGGHSGHDFGQEAIEALLKRMEDHRHQLAVIIAGYADEMHRFLEANPGVQSRFNRYFYFEHYKPAELLAIFERMAGAADLMLTDEARATLHQTMVQACHQRPRSFGNGRFVRNLLEKTVERQANRIVDLTPMTDELLLTLTRADIPPHPDGYA